MHTHIGAAALAAAIIVNFGTFATAAEGQPAAATAGDGAAAAAPAAAAPIAPGPDAPVARVNGTAVMRSEFERNLAFVLQSGGEPGEESEAAAATGEMKGQVLDRLIDEELLHQEARARNLLASPEAVAAEIDQARAQFAAPEEFAAALAQSRLTEAGLGTLIARNLSIQNLVEKGIAAAVAVTDAEVHEFYAGNAESFAIPEQARARHILVQAEETDDEAARKAKRAKADGLLAQLAGGAGFEELARTSSDCPSAPEGGDLGYFERGQMPPAFDEAVFALKPGAVSGVVETEYGFHIIKLEEIKPAGAVSEEEAAAQIREFLSAQKTEAAVEALVKRLRDAATIEKLL
jgi:peptidyl-prolyl cis-trans isomerase C